LLKDFYKDFVMEKSNSSTLDNLQNGSNKNQEMVEANTSLLKNNLELDNMLQKFMDYIDDEEKSNSDDVTNEIKA
jgi:hypothetical protein